MLSIDDLAKESNITPLFRLSFRPFFTLGVFFSCFALVVWLVVLSANVAISVYGGGYFYHVHEMIFGFVCAIIVGFLLTAVQNWTGVRSINGAPLMYLVLLWIAGRISLLLDGWLAKELIALIDLSFLPVAAYFLAKPLLRVKQTRNAFFVVILAALLILNALMHSVVLGWYDANIQYLFYAAILLITLLMSIMTARVVPMFTANATGTSKPLPNTYIDRACNIPLLLLIASYLMTSHLGIPTTMLAVLMLISGSAHTVRLLRWRPWITLSTPLLWSLHCSVLYTGIGLIGLSICLFLQSTALNHIWHLLTVGGMAGLILAMISRVSLGHTGRPLTPARIVSIAFILVPLAALLRSFGPIIWPHNHLLFIQLSSLCWLIAFAIFLIKYAPVLMQPRKDGRPG
ncbi:NnrS family protein [Thalassotalea ponticola]|uniref:NnrS family protein n=1 Tax=Thalassotalea ponticola TaxID=1523392 RepID=UPI0025B561B2|nr:NnrS family protein [Thalassotalea ponticola]MDN3652032.1 NnrS family protein [Thalassotalea ponticola]